jgi:hypothetical protein
MGVKSIKEIKGAWSNTWITFLGKKYSLDNIEHDLIRKKCNEPLIHCALVCAAKSCPALFAGAYTSANVSQQLAESAKVFLNDTSKNSYDTKTLKLSSIFNWYGGDFVKTYGSVQQWAQKQWGLQGSYKTSYLPYDWSLNGAECGK